MSYPLATLRHATQSDSEQLFRWRNDSVAVAMSTSQQPVELDEHLAWLDDVFSGNISVHIFIIEAGGEAVGFCRIALEDNGTIGRLSICLGRKYRGLHYGWQALDYLIGEAHRLLVGTLKATIKRDNTPSRRLFTRYGFTIANSPLETWLEYERAL